MGTDQGTRRCFPPPPNLLNGAQWPHWPGPEAPGAPRVMERSFPPHLWRCLDTGPQRRGLSPSPPNTSPQAELSPDPGMKPALVWTPNAPFSFQASRHLPAGPDPAAGMKPLSSPSPPPQTQPVLPSSPMEGSASFQASPWPHGDVHPAPRSSVPRGRGGRTPAWGVAPKVSRGRAGGLEESHAPRRGARGERPCARMGERVGAAGRGRSGVAGPRGHSPGRLRRGHGAGCGAGAARSRH